MKTLSFAIITLAVIVCLGFGLEPVQVDMPAKTSDILSKVLSMG